MNDVETMPWNEAIDEIMIRLKVSRGDAAAMLTEACRSGKIPAIIDRDGEREVIPPAQFPKLN